jgi:hypothetical protein
MRGSYALRIKSMNVSISGRAIRSPEKKKKAGLTAFFFKHGWFRTCDGNLAGE